MQATKEILAMPRRAYSYSRVSDPKQAKPGKDGLRRQDGYAEARCVREGWCLDDSLILVDKGKSGFHGDNLRGTAALARFLAAVKSGVVSAGSVLIIENIDRLSRQEVDVAHDNFRELIRAGIWIATQTPDRIYKRESAGLMDLMEPIWLMYLAHMESAKKSERIAAKWKSRRKDARETGLPHGKRCHKWLKFTGSGYVLADGPARTIRTIFRLAREGLGIHRIVTWLNDNDGEHPAFGKSGTWLRPYVRSILRGRAVLGEYQPMRGRNGRNMVAEGDPIAGYYPAVVTEEDWSLAQAAITGRRHKSGRPGRREANLFTGIVREATSGLPMSIDGRSSGVPGKSYRYLVAYQTGPSCRSGRGLPYDQFEEGVLDAISRLDLKDVLPRDSAADARETRIAELTRRLVSLDHRAGEIQQQIEDPDSVAAVAALAKSLSRLVAEKGQVVAERDALKNESLTGKAETLGEAQSIIQLLRDARGTAGEEDLRRRLKASLRWLVDEIWVIAQPVGQRAYIGHVRLYMRAGGRPRGFGILPRNRHGYVPSNLSPWDLGECDFRAGDIGDAAPHAGASA